MQDSTTTIVIRHYNHAQSMLEWATEHKINANNRADAKRYKYAQIRYASQLNALEQLLNAIKEELKEQ